jgi:predicted DNA-binding transcriptional regulator AlpA
VPRPRKQNGDAKATSHIPGADVRATWSPTDRIVFEDERAALTGFSRNWWWVKEQKGEVPKRIKLSERRVGWLLSELENWVRERAAARDTGGGDARPAA